MHGLHDERRLHLLHHDEQHAGLLRALLVDGPIQICPEKGQKKFLKRVDRKIFFGRGRSPYRPLS
jgi:hypothetical protein